VCDGGDCFVEERRGEERRGEYFILKNRKGGEEEKRGERWILWY